MGVRQVLVFCLFVFNLSYLLFYREFSYYRIGGYTYFSLYFLVLIVFPFCCHWFGLVFHVSVCPSILSFFWGLLLHISLTFRYPAKQKTKPPGIPSFSPCPKGVHCMQRQTKPSGDMQDDLEHGGRKSFILHCTSPPIPIAHPRTCVGMGCQVTIGPIPFAGFSLNPLSKSSLQGFFPI